MERKERWRLLKALAKASNAFHRSMEESGYRISYGLGEKKGSILDSSKPIHESWPIGSLSIEWKIEKTDTEESEGCITNEKVISH